MFCHAWQVKLRDVFYMQRLQTVSGNQTNDLSLLLSKVYFVLVKT